MRDRMPDSMSKNKLDNMSDRMPDRTAECMSNRMADHLYEINCNVDPYITPEYASIYGITRRKYNLSA